MIRNYINFAWRNLLKHKVYSAINIIGLSLSLTAFWFIALFVVDELSFDSYHKKGDRIYRVVSHGKWDDGSFDITGTSAPVASALKKEFPEVEQTARLNPEGGGVISYIEKKIQKDDIYFADSSFFDIFSHKFLAGNPKTALTKPQSIVITKTLAETLFGNTDEALNKTINFDQNFPNLVTGVIDDVPANSHFRFSAIRSFSEGYSGYLGDFSLYTYILLKPNADAAKLRSKLPAFAGKYLYEVMKEIKYHMELQPLLSIHLHSNLSYELGENRNIKYIYVLSIVGMLILFIAFINYINITTARASLRLREVAVRKIVGADRKSLIRLFLSESVITTLIAASISVLLMFLVMPYFNILTGKSLEILRFGLPLTTTILLLFSILCGIIGGLYPALFLSGFKTIPSLKNQLGNLHGQILFRRSLLVFQFTITVIMIAVSLIIYNQLNYVSKKDLGFNKNQVLTFHLNDQKLREKTDALRTALLENPEVKNVASAGNPIGNNNIGQLDYSVEINGVMNFDTPNLGYGLLVDEDFIPTMEIKMLQGRNFMKNIPTDSSQAVIVNEALVKKTGLKSPVGKKIQTNLVSGKVIIGVIKDFHIYSLQHKIEPMVLELPAEAKNKDNIYVRIGNRNVSQTLKFIEQTFKSFDNESPFVYDFLDHSFARQYAAEQKQGQLLISFTILTICIACLGLFGLITFTSQQRVKEIGVRKVLGASTMNLVNLLSADLIRLVIISIFIAVPIAWFVMNKWLEDFAYRINIDWQVFLLSGFVAVTIAFATVSFQAIKAAIANPVKSLRTE